MIQPAKDETKTILDSIADGVFTVDAKHKIMSFNRAAEEITGIKRDEAVGRYCWEVFKSSICEKHCLLRDTMQTGRSYINQSVFIVNADGRRIPISISTALLKNRKDAVIGGVETFRDLSVEETLRKALSGSHSFQDIISKNKEMQRLFTMLELISEGDITVLIEGESGTGKELFAKAIHSLSHRNEGPLITVNCGSLPDTLVESELFGYKAGAFTDAKKDKPGRLALASGGTLFLDEIGDISSALQIRLLRVLQDKVYEPLGSTKSQKADVRIVSATNKNLEQLVSEGKFRQDLYYRVNVVRLELPPLRRRKEDIPLLVEHFVLKINRLNGRDVQGLAPEVLPILMAHDYPGNIRELENIIEYAMVVCRDNLIGLEHLPDYLSSYSGIRSPIEAAVSGEGKVSLDELERSFIYEALSRNHWNRVATAADIGIHPSTLWRKMKRLNVTTPKQDGRSKIPAA